MKILLASVLVIALGVILLSLLKRKKTQTTFPTRPADSEYSEFSQNAYGANELD